MIKNIVFDMGNVLVRDDMMGHCAPHLPDPADRELIFRELYRSDEWREWDRGTYGIDDVIAGVEPRLPAHLLGISRTLMETWLMKPIPIPGMEDLVRQLKGAGYGIYLLSNTATTYYQYRDRLPAIDCFDGEFISADHRLLKPNREIYEAFLGKFGLKAEESFFVDDKEENIRGAVDAGLSGFVFHGDAQALKADLISYGVEIPAQYASR